MDDFEVLLVYVFLICCAVLAVATYLLSFPKIVHPSLPKKKFNLVTAQRRFSNLAVHADLPRLQLLVNGVPLQPDEDSRMRVGRFLRFVLTSSGHGDLANRVGEACASVPNNDILGDRLLPILESIEVFFVRSFYVCSFFQEFMLLQDDAPLAVAILKCCTQSVVASHAIRAKRSDFSMKKPWNSVPGSWSCDCSINDRDDFVVTHEKRERSRDDDSYEFVWRCELVVSRGGNVSERAYVSDVICSDPQIVSKIKQVLE